MFTLKIVFLSNVNCPVRLPCVSIKYFRLFKTFILRQSQPQKGNKQKRNRLYKFTGKIISLLPYFDTAKAQVEKKAV